MKVNYLPKNRSKHPYLKRSFLLVGVFIFLAGVFTLLDSWLISAVSPLWKADNVLSQSVGAKVSFFESKESLIEENRQLKDRVMALEQEVTLLSSRLLQEQNILELAGRRADPSMIITAVLSRPPQTPYDIVVVDAGSRDNVNIGSEVSLPDGSIIGKISEVFPRQAKVKLFSAVGEETNAILERHNIPVVLTGSGAGNFKIALPRDVEVEPGDRILSPDISASLIAVVGEVNMRPTDSSKEVIAVSPRNIFSIRFVFIKP